MNDLQHEGISNELQPVAETSLEEYGNPYDKILELAMRQGEPLDKLEKWMTLKERHEANEARKAYHEAMSAFKRNPPEINKDKTVQYSGTKYNHASLANVTSKINAALSRHGLSAGWKTEQHEDMITVTCTISHILGHSESTSLSAAPDKSGAKNAIQAVGSTISYLERYTILAITGLATHDMDDDGVGSEPPKFITTDQQVEISDLVQEIYDPKPEIFWKYMGVESVDQILAKDYAKATTALKKAKERKAQS